MNFGCFAANNATDIYLLAQSGNTSDLKAVENIDVVDSDGNTALCSAIKFNDVDAYNILKKAGANTEHKCVKKIPTEQYQSFIKNVASANKSWSFLGLGKWAWAAIGAGVAGGAVAAGMGGGGGGSSGGGSSETGAGGENNGNNSGTGGQNSEPNTPCSGYNYTYASQCPAGYTLGSSCTSGTIVRYKCDQATTCPYDTTECTNGYIETGSICVSGETVYKQCMPASCTGYEYTDSSQCPAGYTLGSSCQSGEVTKYKCDTSIACEGYNYTDSSQCPAGYVTGSSCLSGTTMKYKCDAPATCSYQTTSCTTGFHETGATCQSGETTYVQCEPDACEGFNYTSCPQGWDPGESCQSGNVTKYKCDVQHQCIGNNYYAGSCPAGWISNGSTCRSGNTLYVSCRRSDCSTGTNAVFLSCDDGWYQVANTTHHSCTQYGVTYNIRCEAYNCSSDYMYTNSSQCPSGWELGSSCKSGDNPRKYKCDQPKTCPYTTTSCTGGYQETGNTCRSGNTIYKECEQIQCGANTTWTESGCICNDGYQNWTEGVGCELTPIDCGVNATQQGTQCQCDSGYQNWQNGIGCELTPIDCGANATQQGTQCQCNSGYQNWTQGSGCEPIPIDCGVNATQQGTLCQCNSGYYNWTEGYGCYEILECGANAYQQGTQCQCDTGYQNWTQGSGCSLTPIECGSNAYQQGTQCQCEEGYQNWQSGVGCSLIPIYCGINATQQGTQCQCNSGYTSWTPGVGCFAVRDCGNNASQQGNQCVCNSGYVNWSEGIGCEEPTLDCGANATQQGDQCQCHPGYYNWTEGYGCYEILDCGVNATQQGNQCQCNSGYTQWTEGYGCYEILDCGIHSYQVGAQCQCDSGYTQWTDGYGCYEILDCPEHKHQNGPICECDTGYNNISGSDGCYLMTMNCGNNAHQEGTICICDNGYENWQQGTGCSVTQLDCGANAIQHGEQCQCNSGYTQWTEGYGCYEILDCGAHAYQTGNQCQCEPGYDNWVVDIGCSVYGINDTTNPNSNYIVDSAIGTTYGKHNNGLFEDLTFTSYSNLELVANDNTYITKNADGDVFGILVDDNYCPIHSYTFEDGSMMLSYSHGDTTTANGTIYIDKTGTGNIYGMYTTWVYAKTAQAYYGNEVDGYPATTSTGNIIINNSGTGEIYGLYSTRGVQNVHSDAGNSHAVGTINLYSINNDENIYGLYLNRDNTCAYNVNTSWLYDGGSVAGYIRINNVGNGDVFGLRSVIGGNNVYSWLVIGTGAHASGIIDITNVGNGDIYALYGQGVTNNENADTYYDYNDNGLTSISEAVINIENTGNGNVYGLYGVTGASNFINNTYSSQPFPTPTPSYGQIKIVNNGSGNSYGLYSGTTGTSINADGGIGVISVMNKGSGDAYGIYGGNIYNARVHGVSLLNNFSGVPDYTIPGIGSINIVNHSNGNIFGMYGSMVSNDNSFTDFGASTSIINLHNLSSGNAVGIYTSGTATNSGTININNIGTGTAIGIFGGENSTITNSGIINVTRNNYVDYNNVLYEPTGTSGDVFGIYAKSGSTITNSGNINISTNSDSYGIYAESGSTVINTGTISLNGTSCDWATCNGSSSYNNHIVLNGSTLYNSGLMMAPQMNLNSMGGNVVAGLGSQFLIENELSGDLNISSELVQDGNQTTYIAENMINAGDISNLNVRSASAMFDATMAGNGHDVVMTMRNFDDLTDNKSLASFLASNYSNGKGSDFFSTLKSMENMSAFNGALSGLTGLNTFTQFAHEDLSAMREISFSMNNKLFENSDRDSFDISGSMGYFSFSNSRNGGSGQYGISSEKISDNWKLGYGMAMANINTGSDNGMNRQNKMWLFYMPATYTNDDYELVIAPKAGFANSDYNRLGYNNVNYEGYIEKRIFGLMNDLRYPLTFGNWTFAPDLAFNTIVYTQRGHEEEREFSLVIPDDRTVSVETGFGLYTKYEKSFENGSQLKLNTGLMAYREFGDSYDIKLGIRGMDGTFSLYNNDYKYRGAASFGFDYSAGNLHLYGNAQYFMDNDNYMNFKGGLSYRF